MESTKIPKMIIKKQLKKGVFKKQLKKVDKAIVEIAEMKFENYEEKEEKLDALVFLKNQILTEARELL
jgi:RNA-binding protein YlmH